MPPSVTREDLPRFAREALFAIHERLEAAAAGVRSHPDPLAEAARRADALRRAAGSLNRPSIERLASILARTTEAVVAGRHPYDQSAVDLLLVALDGLERCLDGLDVPSFDPVAILAHAEGLERRFREETDSPSVDREGDTLWDSVGLAALIREQAGDRSDADLAAIRTTKPKSRRGTGLDRALEEGLFREFQQEAEEDLKEVVIRLAGARRHGTSGEAIRDVRGRIHTLKGSASAMGLNELAHAAHLVEDRLESLVHREQIEGNELDPLLMAVDGLLDQMGLPTGGSWATLPALALASADPNGFDMPTPDSEKKPPSGVVDWDDLARIDPDLLDVYQEEAAEHLATLRNALDELSREPRRRTPIKEARRAAHTLKGAAGAVKLKGLSRLAYRIEQFLDHVAEHEIIPSTSQLGLLGEALTLLEAISTGGTRDAFAGRVAEVHRRFDTALTGPGSNPRSKPPSTVLATPTPKSKPKSRSRLVVAPPAPRTPEAADPEANQDHIAGLATEVREVFAMEAEDHLGTIYNALKALEEAPRNRDALLELRRSVHTLKGAAGAVKLLNLTRLAHRLEDLLDKLAERLRMPGPTTHRLLVDTADVLLDLSIGAYERDVMAATLKDLHHRYDQALANAVAVGMGSLQPANVPVAVASPPESGEFPLDDLDRVAPELLEVFALEAEDHLRNIYGSIESLERRPEDRDALRELLHAAHTLKGAASAAKLQGLTRMAHLMEDFLDHLSRQGPVAPEALAVLTANADLLLDLSIGQYDPEPMRSAVARVVAGVRAMAGPGAGHLDSASFEPVAAPTRESFRDDVLDWSKVGEATARLAESGQRDAGPAPPKKAGELLRVPLERVDELVRLVSELVINRTAFEQRMSDLGRTADELRGSVARLRQLSTELETQYEASTLRSGRLSWFGGGHGNGQLTPHHHNNGTHRLAEFDELEMDRYTQFHLLTRSLAEATTDLGTFGTEVNGLIGDFGALLNRQGRLTREIQDKLMRVRMVPLASLATQLHRTVRSVASLQGKEVDLVLEGEHTELDKTVLEEMAEPFLHLLRNAVDHGVEPPQVRAVKGKPPRATISVKAHYQGTQVVIQVGDDGSGIDPAHLKAVAVRNGHITAEAAERMTRDEVLQLIFLPGFSTARELSEVSGRGVGMDIVKAKIHRLKGTLAIETQPEQGTTFTVRLPMTLAIARALLVKANDETYAVPVQSVAQLARVERDRFQAVGRESMVRIGERVYPVVHLAELLKLRKGGEAPPPVLPVLVVSLGDRQVAVAVDQLLSNREVVVKTLGNHLRRVHGLIGATLMGDGTVIPILNLVELIQEPGRVDLRRGLATRAATPRTARAKPAADALTVLVVDDSVSVRRVVSGLIASVGWVPVPAKDGLDALEALTRLQAPPDVVLLDIEMPRMDGYELLTALRSQPMYRSVPVIMLTSRAGQKHRQKAIDLGADEYAVKPFQDEALLGLIRDQAARRAARPREREVLSR